MRPTDPLFWPLLVGSFGLLGLGLTLYFWKPQRTDAGADALPNADAQPPKNNDSDDEPDVVIEDESNDR